MDTLRLVKLRALAIPFALSIPPAVHSILVVPSSPQCADLCGNVLSSTTSSDITCKDSNYPYSSSGVTFENCVGCEMSSTYQDPTTNETDLQFAIYNLRYALSTCLFAFDNTTNVADSPCLTSFSCGPLQAAFEYDSLYSNASVYSYCSLMNSVSIPKCSSCLSESGNEQFLSNFVTALDAACIQQPDAGSTLSLQGSVFSTTQVNITTPSPQASGSSFGSSGGLTLGAKVGIIVGGIVAIMVTLGCCIIWRGKRRRRKALATRQMQSGYAAWQAHHGPNSPNAGNSGVEGSFFDSPQSQRPLNRSWGQGESPIVGSGARNPGDHMNQFGPGYDTTFSPYSSQYTSPVSATDDRGKAVEWPRDKKPFRDDAQGHGYAGSRDLGEEVGERIEMQRVDSDNEQRWRNSAAPVLLHPGNGRGKPLGGLTEEDAKNGNAL